MAFTVLLDANVLYPAVLRDVLLTIAEANMFRLLVSPDILDEVERNLVKTADVKPEAAGYLRKTIESVFEEGVVEQNSYAQLIPVMTNDPKDRHVLAAAVVGRADLIVTQNLKDFPNDSTSPYGIEVQDSDTFLVHQMTLDPRRVVKVLQNLTSRRGLPPLTTMSDLLAALDKQTPKFCAKVRNHIEREAKPPETTSESPQAQSRSTVLDGNKA
jgi:predicted nucleic acid-binding protein